mmetsp:Transcript_8211/g.30716  ORF Transcript_8211/g.30716 Transcript_8211/m.30716 type:complete len:453 (+) Transcript_8211:1077-2435(+)
MPVRHDRAGPGGDARFRRSRVRHAFARPASRAPVRHAQREGPVPTPNPFPLPNPTRGGERVPGTRRHAGRRPDHGGGVVPGARRTGVLPRGRAARGDGHGVTKRHGVRVAARAPWVRQGRRCRRRRGRQRRRQGAPRRVVPLPSPRCDVGGAPARGRRGRRRAREGDRKRAHLPGAGGVALSLRRRCAEHGAGAFLRPRDVRVRSASRRRRGARTERERTRLRVQQRGVRVCENAFPGGAVSHSRAHGRRRGGRGDHRGRRRVRPRVFTRRRVRAVRHGLAARASRVEPRHGGVRDARSRARGVSRFLQHGRVLHICQRLGAHIRHARCVPRSNRRVTRRRHRGRRRGRGGDVSEKRRVRRRVRSGRVPFRYGRLIRCARQYVGRLCYGDAPSWHNTGVIRDARKREVRRVRHRAVRRAVSSGARVDHGDRRGARRDARVHRRVRRRRTARV